MNFWKIKLYVNKIDGIYLSLHGAMGSSKELTQRVNFRKWKIFGKNIPIVISLDPWF